MKLGPITITHSAIFALAAVWWLDNENIFPLFFIAASLHELAHLLAVRLMGKSYMAGSELRIDFLSAELITGYMPPVQEAICLIAGPAANLGLYLAIMLLPRFNTALAVLGGISLVLGVYNLLPVVFLDGGRLLRLFLDRLRADAGSVAFAISLAVSAGLCACGLIVCYLFRCGYGLFALSMTLLVKHLGCKSSVNTLK